MKNLASFFYTNPSSSYGTKSPLQSEEVFCSDDLISEGPIEGVFDSQYGLLKYVDDSSSLAGAALGLGIYHNNVPLIDSETLKFNFSNASFDIKYGYEDAEKNYIPSTTYKYSQPIFLNDSDFRVGPWINNDKTEIVYGSHFFDLHVNAGVVSTTSNLLLTNEAHNNTTPEKLVAWFEQAKLNTEEFIHKVINRYTYGVNVGIRIDSLYYSDDKGNTYDSPFQFVIEVSKEGSSDKSYFFNQIIGISKGNYVKAISFTLNKKIEDVFYIKVYPLQKKIDPTTINTQKSFSIDFITEYLPFNFSYPLSAVCSSKVSARNFSSAPTRNYNLKLLKIKVPSNYDSEAHEYHGDWNGNFDSFLRWTDDPALIYYDLALNSRYGASRGFFTSSDINKWEIYKISKYCNELVKTSYPQKNPEDYFEYAGDLSNANIIRIPKNNRTADQFKAIYPPICESFYCRNNGGEANSIIFLYDLTVDGSASDDKYKKIIVRVFEKAGANPDGSDGYFYLDLINDFGPRKVLENDNGYFMPLVKSAINIPDSTEIGAAIGIGVNNSELSIKSLILQKIGPQLGVSSLTQSSNHVDVFSQPFLSDVIGNPIQRKSIFDFSFTTMTGTCSSKIKGYKEKLTPRFLANLWITGETEAMKILSDMASIFRGMTYYKEGLISVTSDVDKPISYIFTNSNVKGGTFTYANGNLDGNYSTAKIYFKDADKNYEDQIEVVEDSWLLKTYGYLEKDVLAFGVTDRDQARRIGEWLLLTNRFENETVIFSTDIQGLYLKPSDIIQVNDIYRSDDVVQGRIMEIDSSNNCVTVDRAINLDYTNEIFQFITISKTYSAQQLNTFSSVSDSELDAMTANNTASLLILSIDNKAGKIYFDPSYNFGDFKKLKIGTPFVIDKSGNSVNQSLYKIVTIQEVGPNEYSFFCVKHDLSKYKSLDNNYYVQPDISQNRTISFSNEDTIQEFISYTPSQSKGEVKTPTVKDIYDGFDYTFFDMHNGLSTSAVNDYSYIVINPYNMTLTQGQIDATNGGGVIVKILYKSDVIQFQIPSYDTKPKTVFLGKKSTSLPFIKIYGFDRMNRIINTV